MRLNIETNSSDGPSKSARQADIRKLCYLWIGLVTYFLVMVNALRIAHYVPFYVWQ